MTEVNPFVVDIFQNFSEEAKTEMPRELFLEEFEMNLKRISILLFYAARIQACYLMDICIEHLPLVNEYVKNEQYLLKCTKLLKRKIEFIQNLLTVTRT